MANNVTGAELIATIRQYGEIDDDYWDDDDVLRAINDAIAELWDRILAAPGGEDFLMTVSSDLAVTAGSMWVDLPADAGAAVSMVEVKYDSGYRPLRPLNLHERADETVVTQSEKLGTGYRIVGTKVLLSPTPNWSGYIRVWYVQVPTAVASGTSHNFFYGWDRYVWNWVCSMHARARGEIQEADKFMETALLALGGILSRAGRSRTPGADTIRDEYAEDRRNRWPWGRRT